MLYFQESGSTANPAILFLHGGGLSSKQWQPQFEALASEFYCLAPDLPEQGQSAHTQPFTLESAARLSADIIREKVPSGKAHIVGLSLGGAVALTMIRTAPQVVNRALVTGSTARLSRFLGWLTLNSLWMYKLMPEKTLIEASFRQFKIPVLYHDLLRDDLRLGTKPEFTHHFVHELMNMQLPAAADLLVCVGEKETAVAKSEARKIAAAVRGARGVLVPGVGHGWNLEAASLFNDTVNNWFTHKNLSEPLKSL